MIRSACAVWLLAVWLLVCFEGYGEGDDDMATGETGFKDIAYDLVSVQYHGLKAGHDYGQYVRDAETAGKKDIADFFRKVMETNSEFAAECHRYLEELSSAGEMGPAAR